MAKKANLTPNIQGFPRISYKFIALTTWKCVNYFCFKLLGRTVDSLNTSLSHNCLGYCQEKESFGGAKLFLIYFGRENLQP